MVYRSKLTHRWNDTYAGMVFPSLSLNSPTLKAWLAMRQYWDRMIELLHGQRSQVASSCSRMELAGLTADIGRAGADHVPEAADVGKSGFGCMSNAKQDTRLTLCNNKGMRQHPRACTCKRILLGSSTSSSSFSRTQPLVISARAEDTEETYTAENFFHRRQDSPLNTASADSIVFVSHPSTFHTQRWTYKLTFPFAFVIAADVLCPSKRWSTATHQSLNARLA
eukprot:TRINITY_DN3644_c0_g2_i7.p1 TRINITY_DN3644_c0_g2~~TRINITY_DN3644_c0_g2_i7.p1  ORF type:complete len:224 (-),score=-37.14 TRINITY_DN3644_c0_g2_i7:910-1581(-)